jgi:hypothetical protein
MNYKHLVLLGAGTIGKGLLKLGKRQLSEFETITVLDRLPLPESHLTNCGDINFQPGDAEDLELLSYIIKPLSKRVLVLNLCSETDSVRIRKHLGKLGTAYLDTSAGLLPDRSQENFIGLMKYSHTAVDSPCPHWICWGMNPGLVEIVARRIIKRFDDGAKGHHVTVYEHDDLNVSTRSGRLGVGWSPYELIEELMLTPSLEIKNGRAVQAGMKGAAPAAVRWGKEIMASRIAAHEDIWNIGLLPQVSSARFAYALHPSIMEVLDGPVDKAYERIGVPEDDVPLKGRDRVAIQVIRDNDEEECLLWETDHAWVWKEYGVNGVQFQVCKSIQVAFDLLQHTSLGLLEGTYCASTLPLTQREFTFIEQSFAANNVRWQPYKHVDLEIMEV